MASTLLRSVYEISARFREYLPWGNDKLKELSRKVQNVVFSMWGIAWGSSLMVGITAGFPAGIVLAALSSLILWNTERPLLKEGQTVVLRRKHGASRLELSAGKSHRSHRSSRHSKTDHRSRSGSVSAREPTSPPGLGGSYERISTSDLLAKSYEERLPSISENRSHQEEDDRGSLASVNTTDTAGIVAALQEYPLVREQLGAEFDLDLSDEIENARRYDGAVKYDPEEWDQLQMLAEGNGIFFEQTLRALINSYLSTNGEVCYSVNLDLLRNAQVIREVGPRRNFFGGQSPEVQISPYSLERVLYYFAEQHVGTIPFVWVRGDVREIKQLICKNIDLINEGKFVDFYRKNKDAVISLINRDFVGDLLVRSTAFWSLCKLFSRYKADLIERDRIVLPTKIIRKESKARYVFCLPHDACFFITPKELVEDSIRETLRVAILERNLLRKSDQHEIVIIIHESCLNDVEASNIINSFSNIKQEEEFKTFPIKILLIPSTSEYEALRKGFGPFYDDLMFYDGTQIYSDMHIHAMRQKH